MRRRALLALLPFALPFALFGCAGNVGSDCGLAANPDYAGQYAGTFTPRTGSGGKREFRLSVLSTGQVGGFVRDPATGGTFETEVSGGIQDSQAGCGTGETSFTLTYTLPEGAVERLSAHKTITDSIAARFRANAETAGATTAGELVLTTVVQTGG